MKFRVSIYLLSAVLIFFGINAYVSYQNNRLGVHGNLLANTSYMLGYHMGDAYRLSHFNVNYDDLVKGIQDGMVGDNALANQPFMQKIWEQSLQPQKKL